MIVPDLRKYLTSGSDKKPVLNVPDRKIDSRFPRTFDNLQKAIHFVDRAFLFDNSSFAEPYRSVAMYVAGEPHQLFPPLPPWAHFILPKPLIRKK